MHGMTYINKIIYNNYKDNKKFIFNKIHLTKNLKENNTRSLKKVGRNILLIIKLWLRYINLSVESVYIPISHSNFGIIRDLMLILPLIFKKKTLHIHGFTILKIWKESMFFRLMFKTISYNSNLIALCEEHSVQLRSITKRNIYILPNCLNIENKEIKPKSISGNLKLLYLSNISEFKGIFEVLNILKENKNIHLTIAGKILDSESKFLKTIKIFKGQITFLGFVNESQKEKIFSQSHIFILPSKLEEGAPVSIIESLCYGLPIIASKKG